MQEIGKQIIRLHAVDSTNNYAAKLLKEGGVSHGAVIMAEEQLAGRGQRMTQWQSEPGANLTVSVILKELSLPIESQFNLTMVVSLALCDLLHQFDLDAKIKWPTDLLVGEKKICGILIENGIRGGLIHSSIMGIGLNVNQTKFPDLNATSTAIERGDFQPIDTVLYQLISALNKRLKDLRHPKELREEYLRRLFAFEELRLFRDEAGRTFQGHICGVEDSGRLQLRVLDEIRTFELKELQFIFQNAV
jgi:BirA family biotin operon repressor/biotin-[acetyl-CoA-carboxylase] ligase